MVSFDSNNYKIADTVVVTLDDADLNTDSDIIDIYTVVLDSGSDVFGKVGSVLTYSQHIPNNDYAHMVIDECDEENKDRAHNVDCDAIEIDETFDNLGRMLDITFDDKDWSTNNECDLSSADTGLDKTGFTLVETGIATGVFTGDFQVPSDWCRDDTVKTTAGYDIEVNYIWTV